MERAITNPLSTKKIGTLKWPELRNAVLNQAGITASSAAICHISPMCKITTHIAAMQRRASMKGSRFDDPDVPAAFAGDVGLAASEAVTAMGGGAM